MPIPNVFIPNAKFAMPRSYIRGIGFDVDGYTVAQVGNDYTWTYNLDPNLVWTIKLDPRFVPWSSNRWTLDYIVTDFYWVWLPDPTVQHQPYTLRWWTRPDNVSPYIMFNFYNVTFGVYHYFDFAPAPASYWRPPWLA